MTFKNGNWVAESGAEQLAIDYLNKKKENHKKSPMMCPPISESDEKLIMQSFLVGFDCAIWSKSNG